MEVDKTIGSMKRSIRQIDELLHKNSHYNVDQSADEVEDYDGEVGDFIKGYRLSSSNNPSLTLGISVYLNFIYVSIDDKYTFTYPVNGDSSRAVNYLSLLINTLSSSGFEETTHYLGRIKLFSQVILPNNCVEEVIHPKFRQGILPQFLATNKQNSHIKF